MRTGSVRLLIAAAAAATAAALVFTPAAWAGRPLATEDAGVLERRECEIESFAGRAREPNETVYRAQFGCGIGFNTQLAFGAGKDNSYGEPMDTAALAGKTYLRRLTDHQAGFVVAYTFAGSRPPGDSFRRDSTEVKGVMTMPHGGWLFHANLGWQRSHESRSSSSVFGLALERPRALGPVDLMAEVFGDDRKASWVQVGARWAVIPERFFVDTSWGVQTNSERSKLATVGVKVTF